MPHTETRVASHRGIEQYQEQNTKKGRTKRPPSSLSNNHEKDPGQEVISHYFLKYEERFHEKPKPPTWSGKRDAPILRNHTKEHGKTKMLKVIDLFIKDDSKKMIREAGHTIRMLSYFLPGYVEEINNPKEDRSGIPDLPKLL